MWTLSFGIGDLVLWPWIEPSPLALGVWSPGSWTTREVHLVFWNHMSDYDTSHVNSPFLSGEILGLLLGRFRPFSQGPISTGQTSLLLPSVSSWCFCVIWVTLHALAQVRASVQNTLSSPTQPWRSVSIAAAPRSFFTHWASLNYGFMGDSSCTRTRCLKPRGWDGMGWDEMRWENFTVKYLKALGPESRLAVCWSCWFQAGI